MSNIFLQFGLVLLVSSFLGFFAHKLKLPLVVAYLLSGVLISVFHLIDIKAGGIFTFLPEVGVAFVLFLIGMELDLREIKSLGKPVLLSTLAQVCISTLAGWSIARFFGFSESASFYIGVGLAFSSTIVVVKLLLEKKDLTSLYGKLSVGILLLEDLIAIGILMGISVKNSIFGLGLQQAYPIVILFIKALGLFLLTFVLSRYVLERIFKATARSVELLFLAAVTWCFVFTSIAVIAGFSTVIGAFLAGIALASSSYKIQIESKVKPLRDFFLTLFFVYLGAQSNLVDVFNNLYLVLSFVFYALIIKPVILMSILGLFGFRKHTLFHSAINLSSISEFSLVIILLGVKQTGVPNSAISIMAATAVLSVIISSILITYSKKLYRVASPLVGFFEHTTKTHFMEVKDKNNLVDHVVVVGARRFGGPIVNFLKRENIPFVVVDFNPHIVEALKGKGIKAVYGDIGDPEVIENLNLKNSRLIISTASDITDNEILLLECRKKRLRAKVVVRALDKEHAEILKELGADYVILPEKVSGDFIVSQMKAHWPKIRFTQSV